MNKTKYFYLILILLGIASSNVCADQKSATETLKEFYSKLLSYNYYKTPNIPRPSLQFSKSFNEAIKLNGELCSKYVEGICGFAADGDEYLNCQDHDPNLSYENSGITFKEVGVNLIRVTLNIFPFEAKEDRFIRTITYKMIKENDHWVADDILYFNEANSARKEMEKENKFALSNSSNALNSQKK
jgi:hypothetical protein